MGLTCALLGVSVGCWTGPSIPDTLPAGTWGGDHVGVVTSETGMVVQLDCAHGSSSGPVRLEADGTFEASGALVPEHGGTIREGETPEEDAAVYAGRLDGGRLTFSIRLVSRSSTIGPFVAVRGESPRLFRCL
jgi:hypothetical protein